MILQTETETETEREIVGGLLSIVIRKHTI